MIAEALMCMALNIYHEAKNQSMLGQIAVGQVVMNRVEDRRFPNTVCEVVKQAATHYHATYVRPAWAKTKKKTTRIDRHIFYRWE
jgi:spore germination cell wall hydrolase CwlJ-like protein